MIIAISALQMALKFLFEESAACRVQMFAVNSEVQDLRAEYEDIHKQHDEAQHQVARKEAEVITAPNLQYNFKLFIQMIKLVFRLLQCGIRINQNWVN